MAGTSTQREEQAARDLGHTAVSPGLARGLVAAFLATILLVPAVQLAKHPPDPQPLLAGFPTRCVLQRFEHQIEDESSVGGWLLPHLQDLLTSALGVGNEQVLVGKAGWLEHRPGLDYVTGPGFLEPATLARRRHAGDSSCDPTPQPDPLAAILRLRDDLAARGVRLLVMPMPEKAVAAPDRLVEGARRPLQNPSFAAFVATLEERGVEVLDPTPVLAAEDSFLATDTHWRPEASERVARALADRLVAEGMVSPAPARSYSRAPLPVTHAGDLAVMLNLPADQRRYPPERVTVQQVSEDGRPWRPTRGAEVLLLGDSFVNIYSDPAAFPDRRGGGGGGAGWGEAAGLAEQLSFLLGQPVDRIARNGGGAHVVRAELAREVARDAQAGRDRLAGVRVVVWEFAARTLAQGDWPEIPLQPPPATAAENAEPAAEAPAGARVVSGTLVDRAQPPRPGSIPYPDALVALHVRDLEAEGSAGLPDDALVYVFGMRNDAWTDATRLAPGARVTLRIEPWESEAVQERLGSLNRVELDDVDLLSLPAFFGEPVTQGAKAR